MIYGPTSDISVEEETMLASYVAGGKLLVMAGPTKEGTLTNLYGLLNDYGVTASDGIIVEATGPITRSRDSLCTATPYCRMI